jgi:hypothetical protein
MSYELSFSPEFFAGDPDEDEDCRSHPTNVRAALFAMPRTKWNEMARDVFNVDGDYLEVWDVMDKIQETNSCSNLSVPVEVWIDEQGYYTVKVWE